MSAAEAIGVPASETERPFTPVVDGAREVITQRLAAAGKNDVYVKVIDEGVADASGKLRFGVEAERNTFDAARKAGLGADGYKYQNGWEIFTVELDPGEVSAAISRRASEVTEVGGIDNDDGSDGEYDGPGDEEGTRG